MKEKSVADILTIPEKQRIVHYMEKEDGTLTKMEEDFATFEARGQIPPEEFQYWKKERKRKQRKNQR